MTPAHQRHLALVTFGLLLALVAWDASDLDMPLARLFGGPHGFPLHESWLLTTALHNGGRMVSWALAMGLTLMVWWPIGWLRQVRTSDRVQLVVATLASVLVVSLLKSASTTSCPWDLSDFGGAAHHVSHWSWLQDGGAGHCFPAGHASSGFAFVSGYFALRHVSARWARIWLALAVAAGFGLGLAQQMRGAHFMSHTLWTGWLCWTVSFTLDSLLRWRAARGLSPAASPLGVDAVPLRPLVQPEPLSLDAIEPTR
ncbi:MAG: phosphatase PAP2 family protein [Rhizobacter sp.]|nr:phosphatase PAP2 family protein [Rhizobacter sp.]